MENQGTHLYKDTLGWVTGGSYQDEFSNIVRKLALLVVPA